MQLFEELIRVADANRGKVLPRPVLCYLDEFGNIGQVPDMTRWVSTVRSARIGFLLAVQDLAQLGAIYGKDGRQIITTGCTTKIALARTNADDAEWFSRGTGTATVLSYTAGDSRKRGDRMARSGSRGVSEIARPLLTPGEVTRLSDDTMLVLSGNRQPMLVKQRRWYQDRRLHRLGALRPAQRLVAQSTLPLTVPARSTPSRSDPLTVVLQDQAVPAVTPPVRDTAAAQDDGAIQLDHDLPAGTATWVEAPDDRATPPPAGEPVGAASVQDSADHFETLVDG
jgi:type IV secretory pathway TraG/TraD family ATPase VirD4